jgi:hypothetical protein
MGKFKTLDIEQKEIAEVEMTFEQIMEEMHERHVIWSAVELCTREDYGYAKFIDELQKALVDQLKGKP